MTYFNRSKIHVFLFCLINLVTCAIIANDLLHVSHPRKDLQIDEFEAIFREIKTRILANEEIFFYTNVPDLEGTALYFQSQFVLSPTILSREKKQQTSTLLVLDPKHPSDTSVTFNKQDTLFIKQTSEFTILLTQQIP